tara:strand:+ start:631 stop:858 length:228 start_codon:yes stop_codon:yes gene_type:complete
MRTAAATILHVYHGRYNKSSYTEEYLEAERKRFLADQDAYMKEVDEGISKTIDKWIENCGQDYLLTVDRFSYPKV